VGLERSSGGAPEAKGGVLGAYREWAGSFATRPRELELKGCRKGYMEGWGRFTASVGGERVGHESPGGTEVAQHTRVRLACARRCRVGVETRRGQPESLIFGGRARCRGRGARSTRGRGMWGPWCLLRFRCLRGEEEAVSDVALEKSSDGGFFRNGGGFFRGGVCGNEAGEWEGLPEGQKWRVFVFLRLQLPLGSLLYCKGKTPVVSELWGATQQPWGRSLDILREGKEATKGIPWGRSLDNKLRIPTKSATLHVSYGTWELYLKIDKESKI